MNGLLKNMEINNIFSVITISYNQGKFIEETIKSVIFQEGDFFLEYLIVDGGSTDNTLKILKKYKDLIENKKITIKCKGIDFKYISEKDKGPTNALNKGLKLIKGKIIGILNSDDLYPENTLKTVWEEFKINKNIEIVYGDVEFIDEQGKKVGIKKGKENLKLKDFIYENQVIQPETFLKRSVIEKVGIFDENFKYVNDYEFWLRCLKNNINFKYIPYTLTIFRRRKSARSSGINPEIFAETLSLQLKYFGFGKWIIYNLGEFSLIHSQKTDKNYKNCFIEIKNLFNNKNPDFEIYGNRERKAMAFGYLKNAIYKISQNKKESLKIYFIAIKTSPLIFFTKKSLTFIIRNLLIKESFYFSLKTLVKKFFVKNKKNETYCLNNHSDI